MTRRELIDALRPAAGAEAEIEAKFLLEASADEVWLRAAVARRLKGEPLQYILGEWEFMGLPFFVGPGALIPRQDTETLCEAALGWLKTRPGARVLDLCCGTGCIGVSLSKLGGARVSFADVSSEAMALAKRNAQHNGVDGEFYESDLLDSVPGVYDLIACNPPYLTAAEMENCQKELTFEPALALFGGEDGLDFYRRLAAAWADHVAPGGLLLLEIGHTQGAAVRGLFPGARILKDICGLDRVAWVERI
jgi:protein-(glutamine-N5) methyltransferase, release factor-specific